jgi:mono/diheme cytochrome c family protein
MVNTVASTVPLFAVSFRAIGLTVAAIVFIGFVAAWIRNIVKARGELGSEIELAPNRKEYYSDEELEGPKLDRSLSFALVLLTLLGLILPFYWIAEPGRQEGAAAAYNRSFESRGEDSYTVTAQCVNCHAGGGVGGNAPYVLQDADGQFIANASWYAPSLNDVLLRYSEDEVRYILNFGRPGSPMAAWGTPGGGPLTSQQVDNIIIYLRTLQKQSLDPIDIATAGDPTNAQDDASQEALAEAGDITAGIVAEVERSLADGEFETIGEAVFNLGLYSGYSAGSLSCGRCHTAGWSLGATVMPQVLDEGVAGCGGGDPSGIGFNLCGGSVKERFPDDTWLLPDGSWYELANFDNATQAEPVVGNPQDYDGTYLLASDGSRIELDAQGEPIDGEGNVYLILGPGPDGDEDRNGDLASCDYVSQLWEYTGHQATSEERQAFEAEWDLSIGEAYPFPADATVDYDAEGGAFNDPVPITPDEVAAAGDGQVIELADGRLASGCTIVEMPPRTSLSHYDFIYNGAEAGTGYGEGGLSAAGMMPGFGKVLPPEYIQAVVDYERGL